MRPPGETGQTTVLVVGLALVAFAVAGLAVDGTRAFLLRRSLQTAADAAAVAGASELNLRDLYASGGRSVSLDTVSARREALRLLGARGLPARSAIDVDAAGITVVVRGSVETSFLGLVGVSRVPVAVEARAEPVEGGAG